MVLVETTEAQSADRVFPTLSRAKAQLDCRLWWTCSPLLR